ncbi:MAG: hypothetical protein DBY36_01975 [Clostridiales bacterium]|nr:MAG: hypothetical protein DBY36_01975 [Clostridiales bacterium]
MKPTAARLLLLFLVLAAVAAGFCACAASNAASSPESDKAVLMTAAGYDTGEAGADAPAQGESSLALGGADPSRKMIYSVSYSIQTLDFDGSVAAVNALAAEFGGYVEKSSIDGAPSSGDYYAPRRASYTLRIPADRLNEFFTRVSSVGTITGESLSSEDVTLQYVDVESRLSALRLQEERILALLAEADDLQYVLDIERELSDIRYSIESYTSQLKQLDSLISYSTVSIQLSEVFSVTELKAAPQSFGEKLSDAFDKSLGRVWNGIQRCALWFLGNIVEIALWLALIGLFVLLLVIAVKRASRPKQPPVLPPQPPEQPPQAGESSGSSSD